jgi:hypothetical protein
MSEEIQWQPARIRITEEHRADSPYSASMEKLKEMSRKVIRVRPTEISDGEKQLFLERGCHAERYFIIHPKDRLSPNSQLICEHEILTD